MSWIRIRIYILPVSDGQKVPPDEARRFVEQIKDDALYGTYGKLDSEYWGARMDRAPKTLSEVSMVGDAQDVGGGLLGYEFELRLASELFPPEMGGAQHLFSMLAGDLLRFTLPPFALKDWQIKEIQFPPEWDAAHFDTFRKDISNDIREIRAAFKLQKGIPLLAFSFKPRVGFSLKGLEEAAVAVLSTGFNIVELDTRHLPLDKAMLEQLLNLACALPDKFKHVARLSLNLSLRTDLAVQAAIDLCDRCPQPAVLKIDGGLNGLPSVQTIRGKRIADGRKLGPIITCYPLLQYAFSRYVPPDLYIKTLAASGVDIIYPGGRPDIGKMVRSLQGGGEDNQVGSVLRYRKLAENGWPMLSIAGGIYPGQLQAFYELLGPDVAWFLGGGVALHKKGPHAGAELCVRIAYDAAEKKAKAGANWSGDLNEKLSEQADSMFQDRSMLTDNQLRYLSPKENLAGVPGLDPFNV